jgi:ABC-type amino acid transport substrate-binding protein
MKITGLSMLAGLLLLPFLGGCGKTETGVSNMTATDERRQTVDFTEAYFVDSQLFLVRKPKAANLSSLPMLSSIVKGFQNNLAALWDVALGDVRAQVLALVLKKQN